MDEVAGHPVAFEQLVEEYRDKVFRLAYSVLGNEASAEDAAQEIFLKIWRSLPGFRGRSSVSTWIYAIARNTCLTRRRREGARLESPLKEAALDTLAAPPAPVPDAGLEALIGQLPEKYRQVLTLFYLEDRSYEQVAASLDLPMGTVKTWLYRAKKELAALLGKEEPGRCPALNSKS